MKKILRVSAVLLLALALCMTATPVSAAADATLTVGNVTAKAGDTVEVPVSITRLENIGSIGFHVQYDATVLKCTSATMSDVIASMDMANANTKPVRYTDRVILTAVGLNPVVLDGVVLTLTFEVLADAPRGVTSIKVLEEGLSVSTIKIEERTVALVDGGVTVGDGDTSQGTSTVAVSDPTSAGTTASTADQADASTQTTAQDATTASNTPDADEEPAPTTTMMELPEETVVDVAGNIVTNAAGEPTKVKAVGVVVGSATAKPNETVTVKVSLSAVSELTALGLSVHYDATALSFEGGECVGFVKDGASMSSVLEHESGVVDISAIAAKGISGSGDVAELRFKVKNTAKNGEYRLAVKGDPLLQTSEYEYPVKTAAGVLRVEGAAQNRSDGLYAALGIVAAAAVMALIVWLCLRRKKSAPVKEAPKTPAVINVSGEDE